MQKKLMGFCVFAIFVLLFGWAITPAHAHCRGNHTGDHPHCDGTDGTGSADGGKIAVTVSINGLCVGTDETSCEYVINEKDWRSKDHSVSSTISHGVLELQMGVPRVEAGFEGVDWELLTEAFNVNEIDDCWEFAELWNPTPTRGVIATDGIDLLQLDGAGLTNVTLLAWNYEDDAGEQGASIRHGFRWENVPITVSPVDGSRVWVIDPSSNPTAALSLGSHLFPEGLDCGTGNAYITITVIEE